MKTTKQDRIAQRWIPKDSTEFRHPDGLCVIYCYGTAERPVALCYIGSAGKSSWHRIYRNQAQRDADVIAQFQSCTKSAEFRAQCKVQRNQPTTLAIGDIVSNSWGWEQTNVDWYVVTRKTTNYVWLQPIASEMTKSEGCSSMAGHTIPTQPIKPIANAKEEMHKSTGTSVSFKYGSGGQWDGKPEYVSWYA